MNAERSERGHRRTGGIQGIDVAWVLFSVANLVAMVAWGPWETVPFHFIWVSLTLLYGFRVWGLMPTMLVLGAVAVSTATLIYLDFVNGLQGIDEITEVPLMSAMFVAMVWHARRRQSAIEEMERANQTTARLLEREHRFVQDASHELRTPITVALGHAELIQRRSGDEVIRGDARVVVDELNRLRRLADRLLVLAAAERPDFLRPEMVEIDSVVMETLHRWTPVPREWSLGDLDDATVSADRDRLALALDALIENAVKHTGPEDSIKLSVTRRDGTAIISVKDSGQGIPQADLARIFDRFARSDASRSREQGGMGLGLALVKAVVEAHGGRVRVSSELGRGSSFEMRLPVVRMETAAPARQLATDLPAATGPGLEA